MFYICCCKVTVSRKNDGYAFIIYDVNLIGDKYGNSNQSSRTSINPFKSAANVFCRTFGTGCEWTIVIRCINGIKAQEEQLIMQQWVKMPSKWISDLDQQEPPLKQMKLKTYGVADQVAAMMLYIVFVHRANTKITIDRPVFGECSLTYSHLGEITGLSRAKISAGIQILEKLGLISVIRDGRKNKYIVSNYPGDGEGGWAKLPTKGLYKELDRDKKSGNNEDEIPKYMKIEVFHKFKLRSKSEANALKLYLLIIAFRSEKTNSANIGYDKISKYTGILRKDIRTAISHLINFNLIHVDNVKSLNHHDQTSSAYRPLYVDSRKHAGSISAEKAEYFAKG